MAPRVDRKNLEIYFDFVHDQAKCKICSHTLKSDRVYNLKAHAINVHKIKADEFVNRNNTKSDSASKKSNIKKCKKIVTKVEIKKNVTKVDIRKNITEVDISKKQLFRSYIGLVTEDSIPFNILNSDNLKNIIDPICRGLSIKSGKNFCLNSSKCKKVLQEVSDNIRSSIKTEVKQLFLSITIDSATGLARNIFGISAQFIKDSQIQSRILGMVELKGNGASTSRNLATEILNILTKYNIDLSQIVSITSANGAFEDAREDHDTDDGNKIYLKNIQNFENFSEIHLGEIQICRCAGHTAQLCALDVMRDNEVKNFLLNCRNLVKFIKKPSNGYRDIFELRALTLPLLDCPTRWGSTYTMMTSIKNAKDVLVQIEPIMNKSIDENFKITYKFWNFVTAYCIVFEPLQHSIIKFQQEQLHYGNFYAEWLKCKICTEKVQVENEDTPYVDKIAKSLLRSMESRRIQLLSNESLISCLYLDPRFNHTLTSTQKLEAITYLKKLHERINSIQIYKAENTQSTQDPLSDSESRQFSQKADEYLNEYLTQNFLPPASESLDVYNKLENLQLPFVRVDSNVLHFWRDKQLSDPELYSLANICFAIPATQVTIEADNRNRINQDTLENILLVRLNAGYLDEAIETLPLFEDSD